ncbi:MAG TPA: hypothetical protein VGR25_02115 [bacterium]|jgi:hypothetical protein|nr:hypothetical protein [bacterium]
MGRDGAVLDRTGKTLIAGQRVRVLRDQAQEGEVRRLVPRYGVLTVIVDGAKAGKTERMVRGQEVEALGEPVGA